MMHIADLISITRMLSLILACLIDRILSGFPFMLDNQNHFRIGVFITLVGTATLIGMMYEVPAWLASRRQ